MRKSYLDYAMSVIIGRALPDVRDGLKPVHRRILYGMYEQGNTAGKAYKKSARIVGDVMGKYHPHGDSAIYDAVVRMAQDFSMRYRLVDGQGNFGSIDGDNPAAMRYTEVRLTAPRRRADAGRHRQRNRRLGAQLRRLARASRPCCRPSIPNLLVNGSSGIAVGMATNIPPHNLGEVIDACLMMIDNPQAHGEGPDDRHARPRLPDRRLHPRHRGHPPGLQDRPRHHSGARPRRHRDARRRATSSRSSSPRSRT